MTMPVRVTVSPERLDAEPGDSLTVDVTVRNTSDIVEHYEIVTVGLPFGSSAESSPETIKLRPGEVGDATVRLTLRSRPPAPAGTYILGVVARSRYRDDVSRCEELPLTVAAVDSVVVRVDPEVATSSRTARYTVEVTNEGNSAVRLRLDATDPERRVRSVFEPSTLDLPAGYVAESLLTVRAPRPWSRETRRRLTIAAAGEGVAGSATATLVQPPRLASRLTRFVGAFAAVLTLAAAVVGAALIVRRNDRPGTPTGAVASATAAPPPSAAAASPPPSAPGSPSAGPVPSASPSAASPSASAGPSAASPRRVDLTLAPVPQNGFLPSDAYRADGIVLSGLPDPDGPMGCRTANALAVRGGDPTQRAVVAALPSNPAACNFVPVQIRFLTPARAVQVTLRGQGVRRMEVVYRDLTRTIETGLSVTDDGRHGGIDYVVIRGLPPDLTSAPVPAAVHTVTYATR